MLIFIDQLLKFQKHFKFENILYIFVIVMIISIFVVATFALVRPIESKKYQNVILLSEQATYPATQKMAAQMLSNEQILASDYFKLMEAHQFESSQVRSYPAMAQEDE